VTQIIESVERIKASSDLKTKHREVKFCVRRKVLLDHGRVDFCGKCILHKNGVGS
jgi:hypothetical protein